MNKPRIYLIIGCPGSGKSWVCEQVKHKFTYVAHDDYLAKGNDKYVQAILFHSRFAEKPILAETPFSVSQVMGPLENHGFEVTPLFIQERHDTISERYLARTGKEIPKGHLTRQRTYRERAEATGAFMGTAEQVLEYLTGVG